MHINWWKSEHTLRVADWSEISVSPRNRAWCGLAPPTFRAKRTNERAPRPGPSGGPVSFTKQKANDRGGGGTAGPRDGRHRGRAAKTPRSRRYLVVIAHLIDGQRHTDAILLYQDHDAAGFRAAAVDTTATAAKAADVWGDDGWRTAKPGTAVKKRQWQPRGFAGTRTTDGEKKTTTTKIKDSY